MGVGALLLVGLGLALGSAGPAPAQMTDPGVCVVVHPTATGASFAFVIQFRRTPGATTYEQAPIAAASLQLSTPAGRTLWRVAAAPRAKALRIEYGVVPPGFAQEVPGTGLPPPLVAGERYVVVGGPVEGKTRAVFVHGEPGPPCGGDPQG